MLSFYELNITTILSMFVTAFIVYTLIDNFNVDNKNKNVPLYAFVSLLSGIIVSIFVSYITLEPDNITTEPDSFWLE